MFSLTPLAQLLREIWRGRLSGVRFVRSRMIQHVSIAPTPDGDTAITETTFTQTVMVVPGQVAAPTQSPKALPFRYCCAFCGMALAVGAGIFAIPLNDASGVTQLFKGHALCTFPALGDQQFTLVCQNHTGPSAQLTVAKAKALVVFDHDSSLTRGATLPDTRKFLEVVFHSPDTPPT